MKKLIIIIAFLLIACDSSSTDSHEECYVKVDPYNPDIQHIVCPDGMEYSTAYGAGLEEGDIVDIETSVEIMEIR